MESINEHLRRTWIVSIKMKKSTYKRTPQSIGDKNFFVTKVISRNIITDWVQGIRNLLGLELKSYTLTIETTVQELMNKVSKKPMEWYKIDIEEFGGGGFMVCVYGVYK